MFENFSVLIGTTKHTRTKPKKSFTQPKNRTQQNWITWESTQTSETTKFLGTTIRCPGVRFTLDEAIKCSNRSEIKERTEEKNAVLLEGSPAMDPLFATLTSSSRRYLESKFAYVEKPGIIYFGTFSSPAVHRPCSPTVPSQWFSRKFRHFNNGTQRPF